MSLNELEQHRLHMLTHREVDQQYVEDYFGLANLGDNHELLEDLAKYRQTLRNPPDVAANAFDRYVLEGYFDTTGLLPTKWAAARLGMTPAMLDQILDQAVPLPTPLRKQYRYFDCLVDKQIGEDLVRHLPALRFRTFSDHESFCQQLHEALRAVVGVSENDMNAAKIWCATDQVLNNVGLGDYPRRFGYHFDCLTCEPLSAAHALWLNFGKPMNLGPDRVSKLFYVRNIDELEEYSRIGTRPPEGLERYQNAISAGAK
jgi:hypothetical protein